jgi:hypothetical protein
MSPKNFVLLILRSGILQQSDLFNAAGKPVTRAHGLVCIFLQGENFITYEVGLQSSERIGVRKSIAYKQINVAANLIKS